MKTDTITRYGSYTEFGITVQEITIRISMLESNERITEHERTQKHGNSYNQKCKNL